MRSFQGRRGTRLGAPYRSSRRRRPTRRNSICPDVRASSDLVVSFFSSPSGNVSLGRAFSSRVYFCRHENTQVLALRVLGYFVGREDSHVCLCCPQEISESNLSIVRLKFAVQPLKSKTREARCPSERAISRTRRTVPSRSSLSTT